jgi:glycine hydroxymethyltransferase
MDPPQAAMTTRGLKEADFAQVAEFLDTAVKICLRIQSTSGKMLKDFVAALATDPEVAVRERVWTQPTAIN